MIEAPKYGGRPIGSIAVLAKVLGDTEPRLRKIAQSADLLYRAKKIKKNGKTRDVFDATGQLKGLHEKINATLLRRVEYPDYLQGGLREKDYISDCALHIKAKNAITQDISKFFPSIQREDVRRIWQYFFKFPPSVADLLAKLTTLNGFVPQGAKTSGFLANLLFWEEEPGLVTAFTEKGLRYSRFVDDITVSADRAIGDAEKNEIITAIRGMFRRHNLKPSRKKSRVQTGKGPIEVHGLMVDKKSPIKGKEERRKLRAWVCRLDRTPTEQIDESELQKLAGKIGVVVRLHPREGGALKKRLRAIFDRIGECKNDRERKETKDHGQGTQE